MRIRLLIFYCVLFCNSVYAQLGKEAWHWQFGYGCSLDFTSGTPLPGTSSMHAIEGCASISDRQTGQLLFYTDGDSLWDRNDNLMPHGTGLIGGDGTSTQAALIVPRPGSKTIYYVFTADQGGYMAANKGVFYSVVNMSANNSLGDVVNKNVLLTPPPATEKLIAVPKCNGVDYWIITHSFNSNAFFAYSLTASGVDPNPITSYVGTVQQQDSLNSSEASIGYLKASPDGKKLALGIYFGNPVLEIFDFNNVTGQVSNPIPVHYIWNSGPYGVCFSSDNSKLYSYVANSGLIFQYDLSSGNVAQIVGSETIIAMGMGLMGAMQLGPDKKIYIVRSPQSKYLCAIDSPDSLGSKCNFKDSAIYFANARCGGGLPNFVQYNDDAGFDIPDRVHCSHNFIDTLTAAAGFTNYHWSTGASSQFVIISTPGIYWVTAVAQSGCLVTDTIKVTTIDEEHPLSIDTSFCTTTGYFAANATCSGASGYIWSDGKTEAVNYISVSGTYPVTVNFPEGCSITDTFKITINPTPGVLLVHDTVICNQNNASQPVILHAVSANGNTYHWSTGAITFSVSVTTGGIYSVTVTSPAGCQVSAQTNVYYYRKNAEPLFDTLVMCHNQFPVSLDGTVSSQYPQYNYYQWSNGFTGPVCNVNAPGQYYCSIAIEMPGGLQCHVKDTFQVNLFTAPPFDMLPNIVEDCDKLPVLVDASYPMSSSYIWSDGFSGPKHYISQAGYYNVQYHFNSHCGAIEYFSLHVNSKQREIVCPNIVTPNGDGINDEIDFGKFNLTSLQFIIFDRWGKKIYETSDPAATWLPSEPDGTYFYVLRYSDICGSITTTETLKGFITIVR